MSRAVYLLLIKINNYYVLINKKVDSVDNPIDPSHLNLLNVDLFNNLKDGQLVNRSYLEEQLGKQPVSEYNANTYQVLEVRIKTKHLAFIPYDKSIKYFFKEKDHSRLISTISEDILKFKLTYRDTLLETLFERKSNLDTCIRAFANYTFSDSYAYWVYNSYTKHFSCLASSQPMIKDFVSERDNSTLFDSLTNKKRYECRFPNRKCINNKFASSMHTINRIRVDLGDDKELGYLDLFSIHPDFDLREKTINWIKHFLETKYLEYRQRSQSALRNVEEYFSTFKLGQFSKLIEGLPNNVCSNLNFEACSIFLHGEKRNTLELIAVKDRELNGAPKHAIEYDLNKNTFTGNTFKKGEMQFSYDIENDPDNSNTYNEVTEGKGKTWIGMPLISDGIKWGVLRVKNKHHIDNINHLANLQPSDFSSLDSICTHLSFIYDLENKHISLVESNKKLESSQTQLTYDYDELKNFYHVFLHEIRTPISTFVTSTIRIKKILERSPTKGSIRAAINKVSDIKMMGERLSFIATTYYFNELIQSRNPQKLSVLSEIILPVINITKDYINKQFDVDIILDVKSLSGYTVYGDKMLLQLVFNCIINNAGKYSPKSINPIIVSGEYDDHHDFYYIIVRNWGFAIHDDEKDIIFENLKRGRDPKKQKVRGTGIGLYLAKSIMREQNGDVMLTSLHNPVSFKIKIPANK